MRRKLTSTQTMTLEQHMADMDGNDSIADDIAKLVQERQAKLRAKDNISQKPVQRCLARVTKFMITARSGIMGIAGPISSTDPHHIAPLALGVLFIGVQVLDNDNNEQLTAMTITLDVAELVALWTAMEKGQILKNQNPNLTELYAKLSDAVVRLYEQVLILLGTMVHYFQKCRFRKSSRTVSTEDCSDPYSRAGGGSACTCSCRVEELTDRDEVSRSELHQH